MMKRAFLWSLLCCIVEFLYAGQPSVFLPDHADAACQQWVNTTLSRMGLKERIGQLLVYSIDPLNDSKTRKTAAQLIKKCSPGGFLFTNGTAKDQAALTNYIQSISTIPALITFDGEWGLSARLADMPEFPQNAALGCIEDDELIEQYGREIARELRELGVHVNFAPVTDINRDPENPAIHVRSFGSSPKEVAGKVLAYSRGLQSGNILPVLKHFPGQGDTRIDPELMMPIIPYFRAHLDTVELYPYHQAIQQGIGGIMTGHLRYPALEADRKVGASFSPNIINGLLKDEMGFQGLVFSEALYKKNVAETEQLPVKALKAGNDIILVNGNLEELQKDILAAIKAGELTEKQIEEKCRKVLTYKYLLGLNKTPVSVSVTGLEARINTPDALGLAERLRAASVTVLGNYGNVIPVSAMNGNVAVISAGPKGKDDAFIAGLSRNVNITRYPLTETTTAAEWNDVVRALDNFSRVIISVATGTGETEKYLTRLAEMHTKASVVYAFFTPYRELLPVCGPLSRASTIVLAHSAHEDVQRRVADVISGYADAEGKLSMPIGELFEAGSGVTVRAGAAPGNVSEDYGMKSYVLHRGIDSIVNTALRAGAFPGCQVLVLKNGRPIYDKNFGRHSATDPTAVRPTDMFDLADLTQTTGTLLAIMKLYDSGKLKLTDKASQYVPALRTGNKKNITIRELLMHESGLAPNIRFHRETIDDNSVHGPFTQGWIDEWHHTRIGEYTWACSDFRFKKGMISPTRTATHRLHVADDMWLADSFKSTIMKSINNSGLDKKRYVYSPAGFILLQQVVEAIAGMPLDRYLDQEFYSHMGLERTKYLPLNYFTKAEIMPTAYNEYFRRQDLHGYVLDELAACQGGISGNAGLFSTAHEVAAIHQMLLNGGELNGVRYLSEATCRLFTTEQSARSRRGLGFDRPSVFDPGAPTANPCSPSTPLAVYGHTGFTGTCAWADPVNNLVYVFLSNRVCPDVWNDKIITMNVIQNIQETIYKSME